MKEITSVIVSGSNSVGSTMTCKARSIYGSVTCEYQWQYSNDYAGPYEDIIGATESHYFVSYEMPYVRCKVVGTGEFSPNPVYSQVRVLSLDVVDPLDDPSKSKLSYIGSGMSLHEMVSSVSGASSLVSDIGRINQSLHLICTVQKGEVPNLPNLGSNLPRMLFSLATETDIEMIRLEAESSIIEQEPRISNVKVTANYDGHHTVELVIEYVVSDTNIKGNYIHRHDIGGVEW